MSSHPSQNVRVVGEILDAWNRNDFEAVLSRTADDLEWVPATIATVEGDSFQGRDGLREFFRLWGETWETWDVTLAEVRDLGETVVVLGQVRATGRGSGLQLDQPVAYVFELRDGLLARGRSYFDHSEALTAAGAAA
jgi:ketosteroid isomerase-like protein